MTAAEATAPNLFDKVWDAHAVRELPGGQTQLLIGLHLLHEVTSPQAFAMLRERGLGVAYPGRTLATVDHIIPTDSQLRPLQDSLAEEMMEAIERNCRDFGVKLLTPETGDQGIVHVVGPERGLTQPGMTVVCGDSHTSTHGAFGTIALGIGTSQVAHVLATGTLALAKPKVRRVSVDGELPPGVTAKDVALAIIRALGVQGGVGYAYEYAGSAFENMSMEERMTVCNMSIEGGARCGYVCPDDTTVEYLRGREAVPTGAAFDRAAEWWLSLASGEDARFDDEVRLLASEIEPTVTWGINPGQSVGVGESLPDPADLPAAERPAVEEALRYMDLAPRRPDRRDCHRRGVHRELHERPVERPAAGRRRGAGGGRAGAGYGAGAGRARLPARPRRGRGGGSGPGLQRRRVRVAAGRLLDVSGDEPGQAAGPGTLRVLLQPQLQGPAGLPDGPHPADVPRDGRRGGLGGGGERRAGGGGGGRRVTGEPRGGRRC